MKCLDDLTEEEWKENWQMYLKYYMEQAPTLEDFKKMEYYMEKHYRQFVKSEQ